MGKSFSCDFCDAVLSKFSNLKRHTKSKHGVEINYFMSKENGRTTINQRVKTLKCSICDVQGTRQELDLHYIEFHDVDLNVERIRFTALSTFHEWKAAIEKENHCKYVASCGRKPNHERYMCHRSGEFKSKSRGLRSLKKQGSKKIGSHCPSKIIVTKRGNICDVKFVKTHVGHENELCHVTLTPDERAQIANRLLQKAPPIVLLEDIKNSMRATNSRIDLLTLKDLYNISKAFKIDIKGDSSPEDEVDLSKLANELMSTGFENAIIYHKPIGEADESWPELQSDDFVVIIMNQTQTEVLKHHAKNTLILDRTWKISYSLYLLVLLVLDENQQAFPCCFFFINKDDESRLKILFNILRSKVGSLKTNLFMSCTAEQYYNAWTNVMGAPKHHVYCPWSVNQTWIANLPKIKNSDKQHEVTESLKGLAEESDTGKFPTLLNEFVQKITGDEETRQFGQYFCKFYLQKVVKWARCYQIQLGLKDTSDLEKVCKIIKCIYFNIKKHGDLNDCILFLFRFLRDKSFNKRITYSKKETLRQKRCLEQNHATATSELYSKAENEFGNWVIISSAAKTVHEVKKQESDCECKTFCNKCNICVHRYTCSCADSSILWNMCRHIHYLSTNLQQNQDIDVVIVDDTTNFVDTSGASYKRSKDQGLEKYHFANDEDCYNEEDDEMILDDNLDNKSQIKAVSEINGIVDEIILSMHDEEASTYVINNLKNILEVLKTKYSDPLASIVNDLCLEV